VLALGGLATFRLLEDAIDLRAGGMLQIADAELSSIKAPPVCI
jgi:hypothetical protein